jgi:HEAT repeat protein
MPAVARPLFVLENIMSSLRKRIWIATIAAAGLGVALFTWHDSGDAPPVTTPVPLGMGMVTTAGGAALPSLVGSRRTYRLDVSTNVAADHSAASAHVELSGRWIEMVVAADSDEIAMRIEIAPTKLEMPRPGVDSPTDASAQLARPFVIAFEPDGHVKEVYVEQGVDPSVAMLERSLGQSRQLVGVSDGAQDAWQAVERDGIGEYQADYRRDAQAIDKTKTRYTKIPADVSADRAAPTVEVRSRARYELASSGWPASVDATDDVHLAALPGGAGVQITASAKFVLVDESHDDGAAALADRSRMHPARLGESGHGLDQHASDAQLVGTASLSDLLATLAGIADGPNGDRERSEVMARLAALFRLHPEAARDIAGRLPAMPAAQREIVVAALGAAGSPAAQAALRDVIVDSRLSEDAHQHGLMVLGLTDTPDRATLSALSTAMAEHDPDTSATATLALGNAARHAEPGDDTAAAVQRLLALDASAKSSDDRTLALRALGNVGDPQILPAIRSALASSDDDVRAAAVMSLRFVPGSDADDLIAGVITSDPVPWVRSTGVRAASFRTLSSMWPAVTRALEDDVASLVRMAAVQLLGQHKTDAPDAIAELRRAAETDGDRDVREAAQSYL